MAEEKKEKKEKPSEVVLERVYNVPLRKEWLKTPKYKRAKKAGKALKQFISKHMKSENVKIGKFANLDIWKHGIKNPPHHIKVKAVKYKDGSIFAELDGKSLKEKVPAALRKSRAKEEKKPKKDDKIEKPKAPVEAKEDSKAEKAKEIQKEELKDIKKEQQKAPVKELIKETKVQKKINAPSSN